MQNTLSTFQIGTASSDRVELCAKRNINGGKTSVWRYEAAAPFSSDSSRNNVLVMVGESPLMKPSIQFLSSADRSAWKDSVSESDGLPIRDSGAWIETKHKLLTYYSHLFPPA